MGKARETAKDADLILYVVDSSMPLDENDEDIMKMLEDKKCIVLYNKTDLKAAISQEQIRESIKHPVIPISAKEETGMEELGKQIKTMFFQEKYPLTTKFISQMPVIKLLWKKPSAVWNWWKTVLKWECPKTFTP